MKGKKQEQSANSAVEQEDIDLASNLPILYPPISPIRSNYLVSGLYSYSLNIDRPLTPFPVKPFPPIDFKPIPGTAPFHSERAGMVEDPQALEFIKFRHVEKIRLDVDGRYPLSRVSGSINNGQQHWIAALTKIGDSSWSGKIYYTHGAAFPYAAVQVSAFASLFPSSRKISITYSGSGVASITREYKFESPYFHSVEFEFDAATGITPATSINTCDTSDRPASLPCETLSIEEVYRRAGFSVRKSGDDSIVPLAGAGANAKWSDSEMHDAMQAYWSRFANRAQWSMWVFFAAQHETGSSLGGIMFDDIGPNHRQGTAIFYDSFISNPEAYVPVAERAAWVQKMRFWTAVHEMGHSFNLAHAWQKSNPSSWIPLSNDPQSRSFMNYPFKVGSQSFFSTFEYRFSDQELHFMRHAPESFVQMGASAWFTDHGFSNANVSLDPSLQLTARVNKDSAVYEFMEPVTMELKLKNISSDPALLDDDLLSKGDNLVLIITKKGQPPKKWAPFSSACGKAGKKVLAPGESIYHSIFPSAGTNGWEMAEPGYYQIHVLLRLDGGEDLVSAPLTIRVAPPKGYEEEYLAQDYFSDGVGRTLNFDGSLFLESSNDILREVVARLPKSKAALHAQVALGEALARERKILKISGGGERLQSASQAGGAIKSLAADARQAGDNLGASLTKDMNAAAETLGHVDFNYYCSRYCHWLDAQGEKKVAGATGANMLKVLDKRGVAPHVLEQIKNNLPK